NFFSQFGHFLYSVFETIRLRSVKYNALRTLVPMVSATSLPCISHSTRRGGFGWPRLIDDERSAQSIAFPTAIQFSFVPKFEPGRRRTHSVRTDSTSRRDKA